MIFSIALAFASTAAAESLPAWEATGQEALPFAALLPDAAAAPTACKSLADCPDVAEALANLDKEVEKIMNRTRPAFELKHGKSNSTAVEPVLGECLLNVVIFETMWRVQSLLEAADGFVKSFSAVIPYALQAEVGLETASGFLHTLSANGWMYKWAICLGCKILHGIMDHVKWEVWGWIKGTGTPISEPLAGLFGWLADHIDGPMNYLCRGLALESTDKLAASPNEDYLRSVGRFDEFQKWQKQNNLTL